MGAHFWWATWAICSHPSFLVSDLSILLTSLIKKEGLSKRFIFLTYKKCTKNTILAIFFEQITHSLIYHELPEGITHSHLFVMSDLSDSLMVALLTWGTWAIAHSRSFVLSDLSESLTVAHLIWAIWANERWVSEQIPSPVSYKKQGEFPGLGQLNLWNVPATAGGKQNWGNPLS